jgi:long-chain acyl-CoA synthetase
MIRMEKVWMKSYPPGVPAEINPDEYRSLQDVLERSIERIATSGLRMDRTLTYGN